MGYFHQITHIIALIWHKNDNANTSLVSSVSKRSDTKETFFPQKKTPRDTEAALDSVLSSESLQLPGVFGSVMGKQAKVSGEATKSNSTAFQKMLLVVLFLFYRLPRNVLHCPVASGCVFKNDSTF